jgi:uncharacterized protein YbaR (Trm112 family)/SAM-dependent methyltransferase
VHTGLLDTLRCPYCGTALAIVANEALAVRQRVIERGILGCECCAYPVVAGIPVLTADDRTRDAMHTLEAGRHEDALLMLLGASDDVARREHVREHVRRPDATYREALSALCDDAEGTYFLRRFADPTYVMMEALLRAIAQPGWPLRGRTLDLCGGTGHMTRLLDALRPPQDGVAVGTVVADLAYWKLWLAKRFVAPAAAPVCCDANSPLPFERDSFSTVLLADAFPYIWHKRLLAEEIMRLVGAGGVAVLPHLHSSLGENHSAGDTLTPAAYRDLFAPLAPHLFGDERLLDDVLERRVVDLTRDATPEEIGGEPTLTLVASRRRDLFRAYEVPEDGDVRGELAVNPLYRVERRGGSTILTLDFPTPEYEAEFGACRRYLPDRVEVAGDLTGPIRSEALGSRWAELRRSRVLIDAPVGYGA